MIYAGAGNSAYHPRILMKILVQGMLYKIRSSRKLASATRENVIFMHLAEKVHPYFRTIARFRKDKEQVKKNIEKAKNELEKYSLEKVSLSDPECRMMQSKKKFAELSYNVQLGVSKNQIIVSNDVCQDKHDAHQFIPQIKNIQENIKLNEEIKVGADSGYSDAENIKFALDN
ncbi:transposase, partial [Candidatus Woesearchaeota archaeon]|nr:transposase [Candidatus Woesearchaeota archaeon]